MSQEAAAVQTDTHAEHHEELSFLHKYILPTDHKIIGMQYIFTGLIMAIIGGYFAYAFRMQLAFPGEIVPLYGLVGPGEYNMLVTNHGTIMIFWVAMPVLIAGFGNYIIPLMIGCDDMVFPRLNRLSYQIFLVSTLVLILSFFVKGGGFGGAWTAYPPLSSVAEYSLTDWGASLWILAVALEFVSFLLGGINFITTTMNARAPGMKMLDIPIAVWFIVVAVILFMASVGPLIAGAIMLFMDQRIGTTFFLPSGYRTILYTAFATGGLSFVVWAHHQFIAGIDPRMANVFVVTTVLISIPLAEMMFSYIATLYGGSIEFKTPMLWALSFLAAFLIGGVTGIYLGASALDVYFHDSYFVLAHFHYTFFPITIIGMFAALTYWFPKMFGRMMNETLGKIHFWGTFIPFNCIFLPLFFLGLAGQHRRIYNYNHFPDLATQELQNIRIFATVSLVVMLFFQLIFIYNFFVSMFKGEKAPNNPWKANTLEWSISSPPPHGNFKTLPTVYRGAYEYSVPGREMDYWPQNVPPEES